MSKQTINIGASPNDGTGTPLRTSFDYTNQNFTELYTALGGGVGLPGATTQVIFNDGGTNLAGDAGLVYNKTTDALTVAGLVTAGSATITGALTVDTSTLVVDSTNNRVGIVTATPTQALSVGGAIDFKSYVAHMDNFAVYAHTTDGTIVSSFTGYPICFRIANVEVGRINSTSNLVLKGGTAAATGVGVTFPATQVASSDANCLDDYKESTWTPVITAGSGTPTTVTINSAVYTKIGRVVVCTFDFSIVNKGTASSSLQFGLPVTSITSTTFCGSFREDGSTGNMGMVIYSTGTTAGCLLYNNATPWVDGYRLKGTYTYFSA